MFTIVAARAQTDCSQGWNSIDRVAFIESADALTKCAAYYHINATAILLTDFNSAAAGYNLFTALFRESTITSSMLVIMAGVAGADPTLHFDQYKRQITDELASATSDAKAVWYSECARVKLRKQNGL